MKLFRGTFLRNALLLLMGVTFLNMSFFLMEVSLLKLKKNAGLVEAINKLTTDCLEDDRDMGEESPEGSNVAKEKELDLSAAHNINHNANFIRAIKQNNMIGNNLGLHSGYFETFSPPPEA